MQSAWDPEVKRFFQKILNSISWGLIWMIAMVAAGLYAGLAFTGNRPIIYTIIFYVVMVVTLALLIRYYIRVWSTPLDRKG